MINIHRTLAVARKETWHVVRDTHSLYLALGIPVMLLFLFGYALSLDVDNIPLAVWDQERSPQSRELIDRLTSSGYFQLVLYADSFQEMVRAVDERVVTVGITIPHDFSRNVLRSGGADVQAFLDASDSTRAGIAITYFESILAIFLDDHFKKELTRQAVTKVQIPLESRVRLLYNPELQSRINIIPGLIAIILMVIAALITSQTIVRERESGTMEQLISTPVKASELVIGKLVPYFVLGYVDLLIIYLMSQFVFAVPFRGSVLLMFLLSALFLVGSLSLGLLISAFADSQLFATQFALLGTFLPSFILSGFVFPIANMPWVIQAFSYIVPARYYITILRGIYLKGVGVEVLIFPVILLALFGLITAFLASTRLGKQLQ
ncbi:MAG: ABC transporter permease [Thermodesulfobacteriota bacterium]